MRSGGGSPFVRESGGSVRYVVEQLESILSLTSLRKEPKEYYQKIVERQADFVTCLVNSQNERVTYDLRVISQPNTSSPVRKGRRLNSSRQPSR
jgi:hypothetical protein